MIPTKLYSRFSLTHFLDSMIIFTARIVNKRYILERYPLEVEIESNRISEIQERREAVYVFFFFKHVGPWKVLRSCGIPY